MKKTANLVFCSIAICAAVAGGADVPVVLPANPSSSLQYAAEEYRDYVRKITAAAPAILTNAAPAKAVRLVQVDDPALGTDGFRVREKDGSLTIEGGVRGVLYGVYDVLEKFGGVRWYASWCEKVPRAASFAVPSGTAYAEKPAFWARLPYWYDVLKHPDFAARLRVNGHLIAPLQPKHGGPAYRIDPTYGFSHTFDRLISPQEFGKTHPEYFSEIDGKRLLERTQLCLTNPEVFELVVRRFRAAIAAHPEANLYCLAHNDYENGCTCAKCKAINDAADNPGMTEFLFVNRVAAEIAKERPDIIFKMSAYVYTRKPPKDFKCHPSVMVDLCPIEADLVYPLPESKSRESVSFCRDMDGWSKVCGPNFLIWDYNTEFLSYLQIVPNAYTPQGNDRYYLSKGVNMIFNQGAYTGYHAEMAELKAYLQAKWAWNPDLPAEPLVRDFFEGYYGPAAPYVRECFDDIYARQRARSADGKLCMSCYAPAKDLAVDPAFFAKSVALWDKARAVTKDDPILGYNVRTSALAFDYTALVLNSKRFFLTERPERFGPETDAGMLARRCLETMDEVKLTRRDGRVRLQEGGLREKPVLEGLKHVATAGPADRSVKRALIIPAEEFGRRRDFVLTNGVARFDRRHYDWVTALFLGNLAFDEGVKYRLRMHAKVERSPEMPDGVAFKGGYYDKASKVSFERSVKASEASSDWAWYDVGETTLSPTALFWVSSGPFDKKKFKENPCLGAVLIDKIEISYAQPASGERGN